MKRLMRVLMIAGFSSVYLMQGACTLTPDGGFSILPTVGNLGALLGGLTT